MNISNEKIVKNYSLFLSKLNSIGVDTTNLDKNLSDQIANASFAISNDMGTACNGSLLHIILRILTPYAIKLNSILPEELQVEQSSIVKVCLLSHISKAVLFTPNTNDWEVQKRGLIYKYAPTSTTIKFGARSTFIAINNGVSFTEEEYEAMSCMDKVDDTQSKYFSSTLSVIVRQANELTLQQLRMLKQDNNE